MRQRRRAGVLLVGGATRDSQRGNHSHFFGFGAPCDDSEADFAPFGEVLVRARSASDLLAAAEGMAGFAQVSAQVRAKDAKMY